MVYSKDGNTIYREDGRTKPGTWGIFAVNDTWFYCHPNQAVRKLSEITGIAEADIISNVNETEVPFLDPKVYEAKRKLWETYHKI